MKTKQLGHQLSLFFAETSSPERAIAVHTGCYIGDMPAPKVCPHVSIEAGNALEICSDDDAEPSRLSADSGGSDGPCEWSAFINEHGRIPMIGDSKKPWQYRGWLLYYRFMLEEHPDVGKRWDYWFRTMTAKSMLQEPIPQMNFSQPFDKQVMKELEVWIRLIDRYKGGWAAIDTLLDWFLWGFGYHHQAPELPHDLNETLYRQVNIGPMLLRPADYLGEWIAQQKGQWNPNAFYPTPHSVVEFMTQLSVGDQPGDSRSKTVLDPAVGSGRMLMHASNYSLRLYGVDIDRTLVKVTLVNGALYVPWMLRPFLEAIFGDSLSRAADPLLSEENAVNDDNQFAS